jgi:nitrate reductase NapAB chaperone NapD
MSDEMFLTSTMEGDLDTLKDLARKIDALSNDRRLRLMIIIGAETRNRKEYLTDIRELTTILNQNMVYPLHRTVLKNI